MKRNDIHDLLKKNDFIVTIQGQDAVRVQGYLLIAQMEFKQLSIKTEMVHLDRKEKFALFKAIVETEKGVYIGHGDADPQNTRGPILKAFIRQAETRAIGRALRWALGDKISATALEEIDLEQDSKDYTNQRQQRQRKEVIKPEVIKKDVKPEGPPSHKALEMFKDWTDQFNGYDPMFEFCKAETALKSYPDQWSDKQLSIFINHFNSGKLNAKYDIFLKKYALMLQDDRQFPPDQIDNITPF
tara:strand:- start:2050 stop:2778 length:729 start_codon:yes stop_codon:yes gene_type:complete